MILSLLRHCPDLAVDITYPQAPESFKQWLTSYPHVRLREKHAWQGRGWNVKPSKLLELLDEGHKEVIWMDTDVIVNGDFRTLLAGLPPEQLVVTEDTYWGQKQGSHYRTWSWGLPPGNELPRTANSSFIRATPHHRGLLEAWQKLLQHPDAPTSPSRRSRRAHGAFRFQTVRQPQAKICETRSGSDSTVRPERLHRA